MRSFNKPEYLYHPIQIWRRLRFNPNGPLYREITLPWRSKIRVRTDDDIGRAICTYGLYDLVVTESVLRLLDTGETALDVGANMGYTACVMAKRAGPQGRVVCFEANPEVFADLKINLESFSRQKDLAPIEAHCCAVSNKTGTARLNVPDGFASNRGIASLEEGALSGRSEMVSTIDLDSWWPKDTSAGLMKIDVEGHELGVLQGASAVLACSKIRDIIFEDHGKYPTPAQQKLQSAGYEIFRLSRTLRQPILLPADHTGAWNDHPVGVLPNYLATRDSQRARDRFAEFGWYSLGKR